MNFGGTIRLNKFGVCIIVGLLFLFVLYISSNKNKIEKKSLVSLKRLLIASIETAVKGGKEVVDVYKASDLNERSKGKTKEGANDPITKADENSNCAMFYSLTHTFRDIKVVSEEKSLESDCRTLQTLDLDQTVLGNSYEFEDEEVLSSEITVWIDPLDATKEFTEKLLDYVTTMVCVAFKGKPIIGVIHFPFGKKLKTAWAWINKGMSEELSNKQMTRNQTESNNPVVLVSRSHSGKVGSIVKQAFGESVHIVEAGGAGYKSMQVAMKNATAYIHSTNIKKWDICAGNAILNALGGKMTTLNNEEIDYTQSENLIENGILATLQNHEKFIEKLKIYLDKT